MERKRKLPARAAAREHVAKKRTATPSDESRSNTPSSAPPPPEESNPPLNQPQPLPVSINPGQPLPTIEVPQPEDLSSREFQSIPESRVLSESLSRSRQKWIDGLFEKYWTKPSKRKGIPDDPNNPPKESMHKLGIVTITVEPHVFEATLYTVKDPRPDPPAVPAPVRPFIQYGPPGGVMPPPPPPRASTPATPASTAHTISVAKPSQPPTPTETKTEPGQTRPTTATGTAPAPPTVPAPTQPVPSPRGMESVLSPPTAPAAPVRSQTVTQPSPSPSVVSLSAPSPRTATAPNAAKGDPDPIIVTLAEKASNDTKLRDLMKKVAVGEAQKEELAQFQRIIDQITAEYRKKGGQQGPSADRLVVDGRTVKYFANEVRTILNIIMRSNPKQRGADLKAPADGDPLVIALVRKGLDDAAVREKIIRVSENHPQPSDATDLKALLDQLKNNLAKEKEKTAPNRTTISPAPTVPGATHAPQAALRSKGPPPTPILKRDISAVVVEFAGGTGDRYLFPKFSILDAPTPTSPHQQLGQLVIASFLIVRKGSTSEYGGDPTLDYYQPITVRIQGSNTRHYEALQKIVAPVEEVRRYMDDVMDNMTRAEYVLLAMRLPREDKKDLENGDAVNGSSGTQTNGYTSGFNTPKTEPGLGVFSTHQPTPPAVLWTASATAKATPPPLRPGPVMRKPVPDEDAQYQNFIAKVGKKTVEEVA